MCVSIRMQEKATTAHKSRMNKISVRYDLQTEIFSHVFCLCHMSIIIIDQTEVFVAVAYGEMIAIHNAI